jgi:flagellar biosynthesis/type III secretory pathway chaperone
MTREQRHHDAAPAQLRSINEIMKAQLDALTQIEAILGNERHALEDRAPEALLAAAEAKTRALGRLGDLEAQRKSMSTALNEEQLAQLGELTERCKAMNQHNAALLSAQQQHVNRLLGLLRGDRDSRPSSYDATGRTNSGATAQLRLTQV